jgi:hypothetical protein
MEGTPLEEIWTEAYIEFGDGDLAMEVVRRDPAYDEIFPGNGREDGSLIHDEDRYFSILDGYDQALVSVDLNPELFRHLMPGLINGYVSVAEFVSRVENVYERVIEGAPAIRDYYAANFPDGPLMTDNAIVASFLDPDIGRAIVERRIAVSEVGGSAAARGFNIGADFAELLVQEGIDQGQAQKAFGTAAFVLPTLNVLAQRHADPDDDFDVTEFIQGEVLDDPIQRRRMRRLLAAEQSQFANTMSTTAGRFGRETFGVSGLQQT